MKKFQGVLNRVRELEQKKGIVYAKSDGTLCKTLKVLYTIAGIWTLLINSIFILGFVLLYGGTENFNDVKNIIVWVSLATATLVIAYVLSFFKLHLTSGVISVISQVVILVVFASISRDYTYVLGFKPYFYWRHLIPIVLMLIFKVWITIICLREKIKTDKLYKKIIENLYDKYSTDFKMENEITEEQWIEFLENYQPENKRDKSKKNER